MKYNEEKGYYEIIKSKFRTSNTITYGMKKEDGTIIIPVGEYTENEIYMAEWELCKSINKKFNIVCQIASSINWTIVEEA